MKTHAIKPRALLFALLFALLLVLPVAASAQDESVAPLFQRAILSGLVSDCSLSFPEMKGDVSQQQAAWLKAHAAALSALDSQMAAMPRDAQAKVTGMVDQARSKYHTQFTQLLTDEKKSVCTDIAGAIAGAAPQP